MPRHPPCALASLPTQTLNKNNKDTHYKKQHPHHPPHKEPPQHTGPVRAMLASTIQKSNNKKQPPQPGESLPQRCLMPQTPNSVLENHIPPHQIPVPRTRPPQRETAAVLESRQKPGQAVRRRLHYPNTTNRPPTHSAAAASPQRGRVC